MLAGQGRSADCSGVVVKADERIELLLAALSPIERSGDISSIDFEVLAQASVALFLRPDEAPAYTLAVGFCGCALIDKPGCAPANCPWLCASAGVGIGLD